MGRRRRRDWMAMRLALALMASGSGLAAEPPATGAAAPAIASRVLDCAVGIACTHDGGSFRGTGTLVAPNGHVLTATSVVPPEATDILVTLPGGVTRPARIVECDATVAAVVVRIDPIAGRELPWLPLAEERPEIGTIVYTAADVDGVLLANGRCSFSRGRVSGRYEILPQGEGTYRGPVLETTAAVNQGSDGGPLIDGHGRVCGVIHAGVAARRWQGVAVPADLLSARLETLRLETVAAGRLPPAGTVMDGQSRATAAEDAATRGLRRAVAAVARHLVGIEVERTYPPEELPRPSWAAARESITEWATLPEVGRRQRFQAFVERARVLDVNQLLRRPAGPVTGLVVSADGDILTSLYNVAVDTAFVSTRTGQPRRFAAGEALEGLLREPDGGLERRPNPPVSFTVVLADGSRHPARVRARHEPLGVAVLRVDAGGLAAFDLPGATSSPQLGDPVAVVGWMGGHEPATWNAGVVSAAARNRGLQFQTDALLNYGNSGGPVVDAAGNVLGLATAPLEPDNVQGRIFSPAELMRWTRAPNSGVGLVARADRIRDALADLVAGRSFARLPGPFLGVVADTARAFGEDVFVGGVTAGSPAETAGLKKGDRILECNGIELRDWRDLTERIAAAAVGDVVTLTIQRRSRGPRLVIGGRDVETVADLERLKRSLTPGQAFTGEYTTDDVRRIDVTLGESR
jgi:S1-C subfamily serine protease